MAYLGCKGNNMLPGRAAHGQCHMQNFTFGSEAHGNSDSWGSSVGCHRRAEVSGIICSMHGVAEQQFGRPMLPSSNTPHTRWSMPTFSCGANISQALRGGSPGWVNDGLHVGSVHRIDLVLHKPTRQETQQYRCGGTTGCCCDHVTLRNAGCTIVMVGSGSTNWLQPRRCICM